jgi:hypothetical protein
LDFLQFHKASVATFPPVLEISYKLHLSTYKPRKIEKGKLSENVTHLSSRCRSTPTEGGAETVAFIVEPKTATNFNNISSDTFTCLHIIKNKVNDSQIQVYVFYTMRPSETNNIF